MHHMALCQYNAHNPMLHAQTITPHATHWHSSDPVHLSPSQ